MACARTSPAAAAPAISSTRSSRPRTRLRIVSKSRAAAECPPASPVPTCAAWCPDSPAPGDATKWYTTVPTPSACRTSAKAGPPDSSISASSGSTTGSKKRSVQDSPCTAPVSSTSGERTGPSESRVASTCRLRAPTAATVNGPGASSGIRPRTAAGKVSACATYERWISST